MGDGIRVLEDTAVENYARFFGIEPGCATLAQVENSSSGVAGWAAYEGPGIEYIAPPISSSRPRKEIEEEKRRKKANRKLDHLMSKEGQKELQKMIKEGDENPGAHNGLSVMTKKSSAPASLSTVGDGQWIRIDLTADTGACDSVMPKSGPWEGIKVTPSEMSKVEGEYEVANAESLPNLGERHLAIWTEGSETPKHLCMQVAEVHKPLLSLSRCADLGYESRFGKYAGALVNVENPEEVIPLHRVGNLYMMRAWIRAAPDSALPFGRQRYRVRKDPLSHHIL